MLPNETRTLVGSVVIPAKETKQIVSLIQDRVAVLATKLNILHMPSCDVLFSHKYHRWKTTKNMAPDLYLS